MCFDQLETSLDQLRHRGFGSRMPMYVHPALGAGSDQVMNRKVLGGLHGLHGMQLLHAKGIAGANDGCSIMWISKFVEQQRDAAQATADHLLKALPPAFQDQRLEP